MHLFMPVEQACGAAIDLARTLVRKAERNFIKIIDQNNPILDENPHINRLSSFLFHSTGFFWIRIRIIPNKSKFSFIILLFGGRTEIFPVNKEKH